jgi:hypothetical protein
VRFYRKFIRNFSEIGAQMMDTVKKRHKYFKWTQEAKKNFHILKENITKQLILVLPYFRKTFQVRCDASAVEIRAFLTQYNRPISYLSEKMNDTKRNYSTYDKEFYAIIKALMKWRHYLVRKEFVLKSDNHALQFITKQEKLNQRHAKWIEFMKKFTFVIKHIFVNANKVIDALSRRCLILQEFQVKTLGFEHLKEMYCNDMDFNDTYESCENTMLKDRSQWKKYLIQYGLLFKDY